MTPTPHRCVRRRSDRPILKARKPLLRGTVGPRRAVPPHIPRPPYADTGISPKWNDDIQIQDAEGMEKMRAAGKLAATVRDHAGTLVKVRGTEGCSAQLYS